MITTRVELAADGRYRAIVERDGRTIWRSVGTYGRALAECYAERLADAVAQRCNIS